MRTDKKKKDLGRQVRKHKLTINNKNMAVSPNFLVDLQALADKYQVHIKGTVTPVSPEVDAFDVTITAVVA